MCIKSLAGQQYVFVYNLWEKYSCPARQVQTVDTKPFSLSFSDLGTWPGLLLQWTKHTPSHFLLFQKGTFH